MRPFDLTVINAADRSPLMGAEATLHSANCHRSSTTTDASGGCRLEIADDTSGTLLIIRKAGFVITGRRWGSGEKGRVPAAETIPLEPAVAIGGRVVDPEGHPVANAHVHLIISNGPLTTIEAGPRIHDEKVETNANGEWRFTQSPTSPRHLSIRFSHPDFLSDTHYRNQEGNFADFFQFTHSRTLCKGLPLIGTVHDEAGRPVAGAAVRQGRDRWGTHYPETVTTEEGRFAFSNVGPETIVLTVQARGYAPEVRNVSGGSDPVKFILRPPSLIQARVVDAAGTPLAGVTVFADTWRGYRAIEWRTETDREGRFAWADAPREEVQFDLYLQGFMSVHRLPLIAGPESEIVLIRGLRISFSVIDAQSGEKLPSFEYQGEFTIPNCDPPRWSHGPSLQGTDGLAETNPTIRADRRRIRVTAPGYYPAVSEEFSDDHPPSLIEIRMKKGTPSSGRILTASGTGAAGAQITVLSRSLFVSDGVLPRHSREERIAVDPEGRFVLPPRRETSQTLVLHPEGCLELSTAALHGDLLLEAWGSVKGTVIRHGKPAPGETVSLHRPHEGGPGQTTPRVHYQSQTVTDAEGRFFIERFPPGQCRIGRKVGDRQGAIADSKEINIATGQTLETVLGDGGIDITGRLDVPERLDVDFEKCSGSFSMPRIIQLPPNLPAAQRQAWVTEWSQTPEGRAANAKLNHYFPLIAVDGTLHIENVLPGEYHLQIVLKNRAGTLIGLARTSVKISVETQGPLDLGSISGHAVEA